MDKNRRNGLFFCAKWERKYWEILKHSPTPLSLQHFIYNLEAAKILRLISASVSLPQRACVNVSCKFASYANEA